MISQACSWLVPKLQTNTTKILRVFSSDELVKLLKSRKVEAWSRKKVKSKQHENRNTLNLQVICWISLYHISLYHTPSNCHTIGHLTSHSVPSWHASLGPAWWAGWRHSGDTGGWSTRGSAWPPDATWHSWCSGVWTGDTGRSCNGHSPGGL